MRSLGALFQDPPPEFVFEISPAGIAWARTSNPSQQSFQPFEPGVISVSPVHDNVLQPDLFRQAVERIAPGSSKRRRRAVLILPDFCARVAVLGFDAFPSDPEEQLSLVRFRMKKSVPFDIESAVLSYHAQPTPDKHYEVVVVAAALEIVARYEAPFRAAGFHPGVVLPAGIAAANLEKPGGVSMSARLTGNALTVSVYSDRFLKLVRCLELADVNQEELLTILFPTLSFTEDELSGRATRLTACGMDEYVPAFEAELGLPTERLQSRFGKPTGLNAGLLGYLEDLAA